MPKSPFKPFQPQPPRPPSVAIDRMGNLIEAGHLLLVHEPNGFAFEVLDVRPVLNPGVQAPVVQVTLQAKFNVHVMAAQRNNSVVVIGLTEARQRAEANGQPPAGPSVVLTDPDTPGVTGDKPAVEFPRAPRAHTPDSGAGPDPAIIAACAHCGDNLLVGDEDAIETTCRECCTGDYRRI